MSRKVTLEVECVSDETFNWYCERASKRNFRNSGFDLYTKSDLVKCGQTKLIDTNCIFRMYDSERNRVEFLIVARSSIVKTDFILHNGFGLIDRDFEHTCKVALRNISQTSTENPESIVQIYSPSCEIVSCKIRFGDKEKIFCDECSVKVADRGEGFGSTN